MSLLLHTAHLSEPRSSGTNRPTCRTQSLHQVHEVPLTLHTHTVTGRRLLSPHHLRSVKRAAVGFTPACVPFAFTKQRALPSVLTAHCKSTIKSNRCHITVIRLHRSHKRCWLKHTITPCIKLHTLCVLI